ncbi:MULTISPECIES: hypothetical protein [Aphanothece]|uniref:hypothetical protein n=1 Tax=Aphanothece TaxID=1121 RepID=UPI003984FACC
MDPDLQRHCGIEDPLQWRLVCGAGSPLETPIHPSLVEGFALPLLARLLHGVESGGRPAVAINGPVGVGKSSLARVLQVLAARLGLRLGVASIDDFYLPWQARLDALAGNPFGVSRVPPGSHDIGLLEESLRRWRGGGAWVRPRFDKSLRGGQGDRAGVDRIACDAVVVEGWLMGCRPLGLEADTAVVQAERLAPGLAPAELAWLPHWDRQLEGYQGAWSAFGELWVLRPTDWSLPRRWRFQAEARQRRALTAGQRRGRLDAGAQQSAMGGGGAWLEPRALEALVRSSLASLPPALYQDPLLEQSLPVPTRAVAWLDSRRRCVACRAPLLGRDQASEASSSSLIG